MTTRPELLGFGLAAVVIVCATLLLALGHGVPESFYTLAGVGAGGGAGVAVQRTSGDA